MSGHYTIRAATFQLLRWYSSVLRIYEPEHHLVRALGACATHRLWVLLCGDLCMAPDIHSRGSLNPFAKYSMNVLLA